LTRAQPFDYITVDLHLAQDSGLQWIAELRAAAPQAKLLVLTGYASIASTVTAIKAGADNHYPSLPILMPFWPPYRSCRPPLPAPHKLCRWRHWTIA